MKDVERLMQIYFEIKNLDAELVEIQERHPAIQEFSDILQSVIEELDASAHRVFQECYLLKKVSEECEHKWVQSHKYFDVIVDVCKKCGERRER